MASGSGRVLVRMPAALHAELLRLADEQGVSLNHLVVALIAGGVGFKMPRKPASSRERP